MADPYVQSLSVPLESSPGKLWICGCMSVREDTSDGSSTLWNGR